jgi:hypothetical protein
MPTTVYVEEVVDNAEAAFAYALKYALFVVRLPVTVISVAVTSPVTVILPEVLTVTLVEPALCNSS